MYYLKRRQARLTGWKPDERPLYGMDPCPDPAPDVSYDVNEECEEIHVDSPPPVPLSAAGRPVRPRILPLRYRQLSPPRNTEPPEPEPSEDTLIVVEEEQEAGQRMDVWYDVFHTERNKFGLHKLFFRPRSSYLASANYNPEIVPPRNPYYPLPNYTTFRMFQWFLSLSATKSFADFKRLQDVVSDPGCSFEDFTSANLSELRKRLGDSSLVEDGWKKTTVSISVPLRHLDENAPAETNFDVEGFMYRPLISVIRSILSRPISAKFCYEPYEMRYTPPGTDKQLRVYGEMFWSQAFRELYEEVQSIQRAENDDFVRTVIALLFFSDSMMAAKFGEAKLWPVYMQLGNQKKSDRNRAGSGATHLIALFPSLPKHFKSFVSSKTGGKKVSSELVAHCRRELVQACWRVMLDDDFLQAWKHGLQQVCGDAIMRKWYPRIIAYGADLPEKFLISSHRVLGKYPCPRCLIPANEIISSLGKKKDMKFRLKQRRVDNSDSQYKVRTARRFIYENGLSFNSVFVKDMLDGLSLTPTTNAFSSRLSPLGFELHDMLVVDVLHEWDVGVWPSIFKHLLRILATYKDKDRVQLLDDRVRLVPAFGTAIRTYNGNISDLKQLTGYNFEDLLQSALVVFDGLFDEPHETIVRTLLYRTATVHGLAKMRLHTDATVALLHAETSHFADAVRNFLESTCSQFATTELKSETAKRVRQQTRAAQARAQSVQDQGQEVHGDPEAAQRQKVRAGALKKNFNANTAKFHSIGDYSRNIIYFGTTDNTSTAIGESEHRFTRNMYLRSNRVNFEEQVAQLQTRMGNVKRIEERSQSKLESTEDAEVIPDEIRCGMATSGTAIYLPDWTVRHRDDPASEGFFDGLKAHLYARLKGLDSTDDELHFTEAQKGSVAIKENRMYTHPRITINYTTYDLERDRDSIGPQAVKTDVMLLARDEENSEASFWYARVLGVFHVYAHIVDETGCGPRRMEFLWVRWFGRTIEDRFGDRACRLERVRFVTMEDGSSPFGFLDPGVIVRAVHLIPAFRYGRTNDLLGASPLARVKYPGAVDDWESYYVNKFADRDLFMLFRGGGVGHTWMRKSEDSLAVPNDLFERLGIRSDDLGMQYEFDDDEMEIVPENGGSNRDDELVDAAEYADSEWGTDEETAES